MKVGDKILTIGGCGKYFRDGDKAILEFQDSGGDWWADFSGNEENCGQDTWCVGLIDIDFKLDKTGE